VYCVAGGDTALHPVILTTGDTAVFGEYGRNASGVAQICFGPEAMTHSALLQGMSPFYTATFMFDHPRRLRQSQQWLTPDVLPAW
jgi:hypothetical protein